LLLCLCVLAGCFQWTEDSQGNLQSVGLPGVPVWQSKERPPPATPASLGFTPEEAAKMSGPVMVIPSASGPYRYRFYQTGQNHCTEDVQKMLAERATSYATGPAPYCTDKPTQPPTKKSGDFFVF
jgi:hypothetical protein